MSTQIGTLQPNARAAQPMWPVAILALLVVAIVAVILTAPDATRPREETTSSAAFSTGAAAARGKQLGVEIAFPQAFAGTAANTPTELTGGIAFSTAGAVTEAPTELSGRFLAERAKQLGTEIGTVAGGGAGSGSGTGTGSELCEICWKYR